MKRKILILDDEERYRLLYQKLLGEGYEFEMASTEEDALLLLEKGRPDIVLLDLRLSDENSDIGLERIGRMKRPWNRVIVITGFGTDVIYKKAIDFGASEFIEKNGRLNELLRLRVNNLMNTLDHQRDQENIVFQEMGYRYSNDDMIVGNSKLMRQLFREIDRKAKAEDAVLIFGETGVGKELVAKAIHYRSSRKDKPLVTINAAAIPENLVESMLFGYEKGAFTGAFSNHRGYLEEADEGTLFIDEVHQLTPFVQGKLLRTLQEKEIQVLGRAQMRKLDIRYLFATNQDLAKRLELGQLRPDFFYRINQLRIDLPPLRERKEDIPLLANYFLKKINKNATPESQLEFSQDAIVCLMEYPWPGNVRELETVIRNAVVNCADRFIRREGLQIPQLRKYAESDGSEFRFTCGLETMDDFEKRIKSKYILWILEMCGQDKNKAAELLNVSTKTLSNYLKITLASKDNA